MLFQKFCADDQVCCDELTAGPQSSLVEEEAAVTLLDKTSGPGFGSPRAVEFFFCEERELVRVGKRDHLHIAALVDRLHAMRFQPGTKSDVLRIAELRSGDLFPVKVFWLVDA